MSEFAINVDDLSKVYRVGISTSPTKGRLNRLGVTISPFRYLLSTLRAPSPEEIFWALKNITFDVNHGEVLGIIGNNGAGKSTLLKILSRITEPSHGKALIHGRIGSLLEVGTGFHPELTGRENIYLNGAILGMKKADIDRHFDEIVSFAEIEKFIDTPVKRYSSGMYVRLAFSVAAHLETEVLLIDEVLAVGDISFQKKCLGAMENAVSSGRTILFVSHNMSAVQRLCSRTALLHSGQLFDIGNTKDVISHYRSGLLAESRPGEWINVIDGNRIGTGAARVDAIWFSSLAEEVGSLPYPEGPLLVKLSITSDEDRIIGGLSTFITDRDGVMLINADIRSVGVDVNLHKGNNVVQIQIDQLNLKPGKYYLGVWLANTLGDMFDYVDSAFELTVVDREKDKSKIEVIGVVPCSFIVSILQ